MSPKALAIVGAAALLVGIVLAAAGDGIADVVGVALGGLGSVAMVSALFYAIGLSEDRDRERHGQGPPAP